MKDKFDMFNDMKIDENKYDKVILTKDEKDSMKSRMKASVRKRNVGRKKFVTIASIGVIVLGSVIFTSETTWAYIENIGRQIEMFLKRDNDEFKGYKVTVNQEVTSQGIKLTLKELMLDDGQMILSVNLDTKEFDYSKLGKGLNQKNTKIDLDMPKIIINDIVYPGTTCKFDVIENKDGTDDILIKSALDKIDTDNDGEPDKDYPILDNIDSNLDYDIEVIFDDFTYRKESNNKGISSHSSSVGQAVKFENENSYATIVEIESGEYNSDEKTDTVIWEFRETINGAKIMENIDVYKINKEIKIDYKDYDGILTIETVRVSPISAKVKYRYKSNVNRDENRYQSAPYIDVFDENGNMIPGSGTGSGDEYNIEFVKELDLTGKEKDMVIKICIDDENKMKYIDNGEIIVELDK